jgi:hypothetical protein
MPRFVFVLACATGIAHSRIASKIKRLSHIKLYGVATASRCFQAALLRKRLARVELGGTGMT